MSDKLYRPNCARTAWFPAQTGLGNSAPTSMATISEIYECLEHFVKD